LKPVVWSELPDLKQWREKKTGIKELYVTKKEDRQNNIEEVRNGTRMRQNAKEDNIKKCKIVTHDTRDEIKKCDV
jgi:hypothetical protein